MSVAVSLTVPQFTSDPALVLDAATAAEDLGLSGVFCFDHLVPIGDVHRPVLELAATIGALAARTKEITVGSLVMRAPLRGPRISAAIASTVASIAPGRTIIGLGAGDAMSEAEAVRFGERTVDLAGRVAAMVSTVETIKSEAPDVVVWIGGRHPRVLEAAARYADGWNGWLVGPEELAEIKGGLVAAASTFDISWGGAVLMAADGDDLDRLIAERGGTGGVVAGTTGEIVAHLGRLVEAGASHLVVSVLPNRPERWEMFAAAIARLGIDGRSQTAG